MTWVTPVRKLIAQLSLDLWMGCHRLGIPAKCVVSHSSVTSRYVHIKGGPTVRLSDHFHNDPNCPSEIQVIVTERDDPKEKLAEISRLLEQFSIGLRAAAA